MAMPWVLLKCVAKAAVKNIANLVSFGFAGEMVVDTWEYWQKDTQEKQRQEELQQLAQAAAKDVRRKVEEIVQVEAAALGASYQRQLEAYLQQIPAMIRRTSRRAADSTGRTIPPGLKLRKADDLLNFIPPKLPHFQTGDRPLPAVDWELGELLGVGGFGEVWKAHNPHFDGVPPVALKFCLDAQAKNRLLEHEAAVLNQVMRHGKHEGIIGLRHTYLSADPPCLEYEYIEGGDLAGLLGECKQQHGGMKPEEATRIVQRLTEVLAPVHRLQPPIVHRDLKPANILVQGHDGNYAFKVADFGIGGLAIGKAIEQTRQGTAHEALLSTMLRGAYTPLYASPQQMAGQAPDPRDDVYALGVIWYQLLTGDLTSGAPTGLSWADDLQNAGLARPLVQLLGACVATRPEMRPADAGEMARRLASSQATGRSGNPAYQRLAARAAAAAPAGGPKRRVLPPPIPLDDEPESILTIIPEIPRVLLVEQAPVERRVEKVAPFNAAPMVWEVPSWLSSAEEMAEATHRFWLLGYANAFAPRFQKIAQTQPRADFVRYVVAAARFLNRHDLPIFKDEVLIEGRADATMRLTTYRMIVSSPYGQTLCLPLNTLADYAADGRRISIQQRSGEILRWEAGKDPLANLAFPQETFVRALLRMRLWSQLASEALPHLACTGKQLRALQSR